jgi:hypothetical protein
MEERQKARRQARAKERQRKRAENSASQKTGHNHLNIFDNDQSSTDPLQNNNSSYPQWSWDHIRPWTILRRDTSYPEDQVRQIAHHDIFIIEKMTGWKTHGSNEAGSLEAAGAVKKYNPRIKTFFYLNAMIHYPGYEANNSFKNEWASRTCDGEKVFMFKQRYKWYNHSNLEFREWWINRALDIVSHDEMDGVFIDAIMKTSIRHFDCPDNEEAYFATATELRRRLPEGKLLIGNALRPKTNNRVGGYGNIRHLQYLDGSYFEGWMGDADSIAQAIDLMSAASKAGRLVLLNAGPAFKSKADKTTIDSMKSINDRYTFMKKFIDFPLAIFLLAVEPYSYFSYHYNVDAKPGGRNGRAAFDCHRFQELTRKLGEPKGSYSKEDEYVYSREYDYISVWVNLKSREVKLMVKEVMHDEL